MQYATINKAGEENLTAWLATILKDGDIYAEDWAEKLIAGFDGSYQTSVEVSATKTISGHPETFTFSASDLDWHEAE